MGCWNISQPFEPPPTRSRVSIAPALVIRRVVTSIGAAGAAAPVRHTYRTVQLRPADSANRHIRYCCCLRNVCTPARPQPRANGHTSHDGPSGRPLSPVTAPNRGEAACCHRPPSRPPPRQPLPQPNSPRGGADAAEPSPHLATPRPCHPRAPSWPSTTHSSTRDCRSGGNARHCPARCRCTRGSRRFPARWPSAAGAGRGPQRGRRRPLP